MAYRDYTNVSENIKNHYKKMRENHTFNFNLYLREKYLDFHTNPIRMTIWDAMEKLHNFIDISDPDINLPNMYHLFQTAEAIRKDGLPDWLQLVGLIHDLGKVMYIKGNDDDGTSIKEQWSLVGDTFIVGCKLPSKMIYPEFNKLNPDMDIEKYNTDNGLYRDNCGLKNCVCSFGHDEYLYQVLKYNKTSLPLEALYIIRFHSLYVWHQEEQYKHLASDYDLDMLPILKQFQKYDLYTKCDKTMDITKLKEYYSKIIQKYFKYELLFW